MRTTIRLAPDLLRLAKARAAASGRSLNEFIEDAVRAALAVRAGAGNRASLPSFGGRGLQAGVDLDDTASLLDRMEESPGSYQATVAPRRVDERPRERRKKQ